MKIKLIVLWKNKFILKAVMRPHAGFRHSMALVLLGLWQSLESCVVYMAPLHVARDKLAKLLKLLSHRTTMAVQSILFVNLEVLSMRKEPNLKTVSA